MKKSVVIKKYEICFNVENDKIVFKNQKTGNFIGMAFKKMMEDPSKWEDLVGSIN